MLDNTFEIFLEKAALIVKEQNKSPKIFDSTLEMQNFIEELQIQKLALQMECESLKKRSIFEKEESKKSFQSIVEQSFEPISIADLDGNYVFINDAFCKLVGYSQEELLTMKVFDLKYAPDTPPIFTQMKEKGTGNDDIPLKRKDGSFFLANIRGKIITIGEEKLALGIINDISKQKEQELQQIATQEAFELAVNGTSAGVWDWKNMNEDEEWWSPQFYYMLGYTQEELPAKHSNFKNVLLHPDYLEPVFALVKRHIEERVPFDIEIQLLTKNNGYQWFRSTAISQRDKDGNPIRMVGSIVNIHSRKIAEEQNTYYRYLLEKSQEMGNIGAGEFDLVNKKITWTDASYHIFEIPLDTTLNYEICMRQIHFEDRNYIREEWKKSVLDKTPFDVTYRLLINGKVKWIRQKATIYYDDNNRAVSAIGFIQDITKFKNTEDELQQTQKTLELALEASNAGVWTREGENLEKGWWSPNFYKLLGYQNNEVQPTSAIFSETVHPDDLPLIFNAVITPPKEQELVHFNIEYRLKNKQGNYRWFKSRGSAERNEKGMPIKLIGTIIDIHDEKNKELLIQRQQYLLEHTQEIGHIGTWELDMIAGVLTWTKENYKIFGITADMPISYELFLQQVYPDDRNYVNEEWSKAVVQKTPYDVEHRLLVDGTIKWVREKATIYYNEKGEPTSAVGFTQDVTKFKNTESKLQKAKEEANHLAKIKEMFLANMSHEIRTPMNGILGFSRLLLETFLDKTQRDYAESIYHSAENLLLIINDILDFSKIESGKLELQKVNFNLLEKIHSTLKMFAVAIEEKGLYLHLQPAPEIPVCMIGAPDRIAQVLINLVGNAIKFTNKGGINLSIQVQDSNYLLFEVKDTGIGIPKEKLDDIFEAFTQVESYQTREHSGTGLGLTISKQLVELMGGKIEVHSTLSQGSTFYFTIPFVSCEPHTVLPNNNAQLPKFALKSHILVAEDHPVNQKLALVYLTRLGCSYELVTNGEEAVAKFSEQKFDAILMDIQMPKMDGIEATIQIRKINPTIPIIAMTAHALEKEKQHCFSIGMNDYLTKPFKIEQLENLLSKHLSAYNSDKNSFNDALKSLEDDKELLGDLLEILEVELVKFVEEVRDGVEQNDILKIGETLHKMSPSFEIFRLTKQAELTKTIKKLLSENSSKIIVNQYFQELEKSIPPLLSSIEEWKSKIMDKG